MKNIYTTFLFLFSVSFLMAQNPMVTTISDQFSGSGGVKLGPDGFLYVADFGININNANGSQVWRINVSTGERTLFASGLSGASGNDFDSNGNLFQSNILAGRISKITPDGSVSTFATQGFQSPVGIAIDGADNLFVCNCGNKSIRKVTPNGVSTNFVNGNLFSCPNGIAIDFAENLYVCNFSNGSVIKITPEGTASFFVSIPGNNNGHLAYSETDSLLYVNSVGSSSVYKVTLNGDVTKIAGSGARGNTDGPALQATFSKPNGLEISVTGDTLWLNSSIPLDNQGTLNPSVVRMITGLKPNATATTEKNILPKFKISPNPASSKIVIELDMPKESALTADLFDIKGKKIKSDDLGKIPTGLFQKEISLEGIPPGIYFLAIMGEQFAINRKLIVSK